MSGARLRNAAGGLRIVPKSLRCGLTVLNLAESVISKHCWKLISQKNRLLMDKNNIYFGTNSNLCLPFSA